ncbi:cob(I)yrinic acid a,c-diamide adenosyltransferase [Bacillus sp. FJAT-42376]|uniref:cob(I)yrinic acid a,c-diamide adenosyltransferase n=1 Tax=Bacillus sp. FJAT-42376 TaxID=2014076 RepID=UPI000F4E93D2|nr:cob(I)yrinic acid a,c-diamide adenosyltransferase [Bacillus sp. FJAT-42376]AZB43378.1 cob(I)yrinic acid a,c-diamide adenosyltransferase [Bacillus sp. FJAT-42376]
MNLYTRTGDKGQTSLIGGRVDKDDIRVEAYGTLDELNAIVGHAMTLLTEEKYTDIFKELEKIQHELFDCGGDLASVLSADKRQDKTGPDMIVFLENRIDEYVKEAPPLERFILPGGAQAAAVIHLARTVARRAERRIVTLQKHSEINEHVLKYINRLSDYFFSAARVINFRAGAKDVEYERSAIVFKGKNKNQ